MEPKLDNATWVYVQIQNPGSADHIVGQHDEKHDVSFIPVFLNKESAIAGFAQLPKEKGHKYEIQAIIFEDLSRQAASRGFLIFVLDEEGNILKKLTPTPPAA